MICGWWIEWITWFTATLPAVSPIPGRVSAVESFSLASQNVQPEGIADPPPALTVFAPVDGASVLADDTTLVSGRVDIDTNAGPVANITLNGVTVDAVDTLGNFFAPGHGRPRAECT